MIKNYPTRVCIALVNIYRKYLSPLKPFGMCKYTPTCSQYAIDAFNEHGFFKGMMLGLWRILRCNPFSKGGYDPVPKNIKIRRK